MQNFSLSVVWLLVMAVGACGTTEKPASTSVSDVASGQVTTAATSAATESAAPRTVPGDVESSARATGDKRDGNASPAAAAGSSADASTNAAAAAGRAALGAAAGMPPGAMAASGGAGALSTGQAGSLSWPAGGVSAPAAGSGGVANAFSYLIGADVTDQEPAPREVRARLLDSMLAHGFNAIRLRTFVDPRAADGYDQKDGYGDLLHTIDFAQQIKAAGMFLAIDFHYSDNWADPGKQCVPIAWQKYQNITELAGALSDYTRDAVQQLIAANARPDLVQIGNEITPGMLLHRCDSRGLPTADHNVRGSIQHWPDLGALLKAGVDAVRELDPGILIALHIDRGGDKPSETPGSALDFSIDFLTQATKYVRIDALGESCYQRYQGDPASVTRSQAGWRSTLGGVIQRFPDIQIYAAEYGPAQRPLDPQPHSGAHSRS